MCRHLVLPLLAVAVFCTISVSGVPERLVQALIAMGLQNADQVRKILTPAEKMDQACTSKTVLDATKAGAITQPGFAGAGYPRKTDCTWVIKAPSGYRLKLMVVMVELDCEATAILEALDTGRKDTELNSTKICSGTIPNSIPIFSYTNEMTLRFTAPDAGYARFIVQYESIIPIGCGTTFVRPRYSLENLALKTTTTTTEGPLPENPMLGIVGGEEAAAHSWPWIITLTYWHFHQCAAILLNHGWAITAAHCIDEDLFPAAELMADIGRHDSGFMEDVPPKRVQIVGIKKFIKHEKFDPDTFKNDIALIQLNGTVEFNEHIQPICISRHSPIKRQKCVIAGWGVTEGNDDVLNQGVVPIIPRKICNQKSWYNGRVLDEQFCAGYEQGITDTCTGDSGGPLMCPTKEGTWKLVGITSWGDGCGEPKKPGVYTRLDGYLEWITENSNGEIRT